jgi:hypothetical protein
MDELVALIVKKTKISETMAVTIVNLVIDYIGKKLPAPWGSQLKAVLSNEALIDGAENLLGSLAESMEKKSAAKKKH